MYSNGIYRIWFHLYYNSPEPKGTSQTHYTQSTTKQHTDRDNGNYLTFMLINVCKRFAIICTIYDTPYCKLRAHFVALQI